jgi:hypothetical protein
MPNTMPNSVSNSVSKQPQPPAKKESPKQPTGPDPVTANANAKPVVVKKIPVSKEPPSIALAGETVPAKAPSTQNTPPVKTVAPPSGRPVEPKAFTAISPTEISKNTPAKSDSGPVAQNTATAIQARGTVNLGNAAGTSDRVRPTNIQAGIATQNPAQNPNNTSQPLSTRAAAGNASNGSGSAGNGDYTPETDARRVTETNPALNSGQVQHGIKIGIPASEMAKMNPAQLSTAIRAVNLGLPYSASDADVNRSALNLTQLNPNSEAGQADTAARVAVNTELSKKEYEAALKEGKVRTIPTGEKMTASEEAAFQLRIDTNGMPADQVKLSVSRKIAEMNGVSLPANATQEQISRANMVQSMTWLASQPNSGITVSGSDPNFENATHKQMLDGYKKVFNMSADASWADVMQEWQKRHATRANAAGLNESPQVFYQRTSGLTVLRAANPSERPGGTATTQPNTDTQPTPSPTSRLPVPGEFGRQAHATFMDPNNQDAFNIQLSPADQPLNLDNVFAYNEASIARKDKDKDGQENRTEFNQIIQGLLNDPVEERRRGDNRFKSTDVNQDGSISPVEQAAMTLYELDFARRSKADTNQLSRESADWAFTMVQEKPDEVRAALDKIIKDQKLAAEYQRYQTELKRVQENNARFDAASSSASSSESSSRSESPSTPVLPGEFGRRAALASQADPALFDKGVQITDSNNPLKADFFAFSETDIARIDGNIDGQKDRKLTMKELDTEFDKVLAQVFPKAAERTALAGQIFKALDANQDSAIDVVENMAQIWTQMTLSVDAPQTMTVTNTGIGNFNTLMMTDAENVRVLLDTQIQAEQFREAYLVYQQELEAARKP